MLCPVSSTRRGRQGGRQGGRRSQNETQLKAAKSCHCYFATFTDSTSRKNKRKTKREEDDLRIQIAGTGGAAQTLHPPVG
jgi:hypothetical protein